jgi:hypothetical protein
LNNNIYAAPRSAAGAAILGQSRLRVWLPCLASFALTVALIHACKMFTGLDLFSFVMWAFVPVGAMVCGAIALSGFMYGANRHAWSPDGWDLLFLMTLCVLLQLLLVALEYWTVQLVHPEWVDGMGFAHFFSASLMSAKYTIHSRQFANAAPAQAMGQAGLLMLLPRMGCLLAMAKVVQSSFGRPTKGSAY